jgi:hypothetical protein
MNNAFTYTESDLSLRLVEVWYDITWAYYMTYNADHVANRIDKRRKTLSSSASVASTTSVAEDGSVVGKSMEEKLYVLQRKLQQVTTKITLRHFENICNVSMKSNDVLYAGFNAILEIAQYLLLYEDAYQNLLTPEEIKTLELPYVFQCIYYQLCTFMLHTPMGRHAMKLVIAPSKITHATYNICRQKFCELLYEETSIVQDGLFLVAKHIRLDRSQVSHVNLSGGIPETESDFESADLRKQGLHLEPQGLHLDIPETENLRQKVPDDESVQTQTQRTMKTKTFPTIDLEASSSEESEYDSYDSDST